MLIYCFIMSVLFNIVMFTFSIGCFMVSYKKKKLTKDLNDMFGGDKFV